ncbi:MAG: RNA-binding protein [Gammaproteobacteria bacterium RIFCSPLOWO2_02_47_7]|nr:MAG: RNA-binding protein [Gammaproteobacteria bacterium RIFCSPLOWO2_02_47_7]OGT74566.1 MAG: RNA-binding protein [Gammaproteobacteria bacterium RIFCSPLOWO2_12_47_11]
MKKMFVSNLPFEASEENVRELFSEYGTVRSIQIATDIFTRKCRGFGFVEMEGHEARAAVSGLDGKSFNGKFLRVRFDDPRSKQRGGRKRN